MSIDVSKAPPLPDAAFSQAECLILESFDHHTPSDAQLDRIQKVRLWAKAFASAIIANCPASADRTAALRLAHEAMMTANKSIVLEMKAL